MDQGFLTYYYLDIGTSTEDKYIITTLFPLTAVLTNLPDVVIIGRSNTSEVTPPNYSIFFLE
jgi:hypothetical protein